MTKILTVRRNSIPSPHQLSLSKVYTADKHKDSFTPNSVKLTLIQCLRRSLEETLRQLEPLDRFRQERQL